MGLPVNVAGCSFAVKPHPGFLTLLRGSCLSSAIGLKIPL